MEDPISREARRIEVEQTEAQVTQAIHSGVSKFLQNPPVVQVQRDELVNGYRVSVDVVDNATRHRVMYIITEEHITQFCTSVEAWQDYLWKIIKGLVGELKEVAPNLLKPERTGWYETGLNGRVTAAGRKPLTQLLLGQSARLVELETKQREAEEQMAIESIKKAMKRS